MTTATRTSPNGIATGFVYRRQWVWIDYPDPLPEPEPTTSDPVADSEPARPRFRPNPDYGPRVDEDGHRLPGFAARVLVNPNGAELRQERDAWHEITRQIVETTAYHDALDAYLRIVAERVPEWRACAGGEDGSVVAIPAPGECPDNPDQWQAFYTIPEDLMYWVIGQVHIAHLVRPDSPKVQTATVSPTPSTSAGTRATPIPDTSDPAPEPPSS